MKKERMKNFLKDLWDVVKFTLIVLVIVVPIRVFIAQPFIVSGQSMAPNFHDGDYLIVDEISYRYEKPKRGDVVIFRLPSNPKRFLIKRVIGLPGETVRIENGKVTVITKDGKEIDLPEDYIKEPFHTTGEWKLKDDEYFVMGDNRNNSSDSRVWGVLNEKYLIGRALVRLFPVKDLEWKPGALDKGQE